MSHAYGKLIMGVRHRIFPMLLFLRHTAIIDNR